MSEYGYRSTLGLTALFTLTFPWFLNAFIMANCLAYEKKRGRIDFDIYGITSKCMYQSTTHCLNPHPAHPQYGTRPSLA